MCRLLERCGRHNIHSCCVSGEVAGGSLAQELVNGSRPEVKARNIAPGLADVHLQTYLSFTADIKDTLFRFVSYRLVYLGISICFVSYRFFGRSFRLVSCQ